MVTLTINGKQVQAKEGEMLLAVIRREGIEVPSTCHHEAVEPYGACRLCTVEITKPDWDGWSKQVTSCLYPVEQDLMVTTHSESLNDLRATLLDLMLARSPQAKLVQDMAAEYGVTKSSFDIVPDANNCILCGLCTRVCDAMGFKAISTVGRGHGKEIAPPLGEAPPDCVGCLSCAQICPTNYIEFTETKTTRKIWGKTFKLIKCETTGQTTITEEFAAYLNKHRNIPEDYFKRSDLAHRRELAATMGKIANWDREEAE